MAAGVVALSCAEEDGGVELGIDGVVLQAIVEADSGEVMLTTLYPENGYLLARFCNYSDEAATVKFKSAVGRVSAETDLLGNDLSTVTDGKLTFRPWEIKTVKIKL